MLQPELSPETVRALQALAHYPDPLVVAIRPWDAWVAVAVIQFAWRNPHLSLTQRQQAEAVGRALQAALAAISPAAAVLLEAGWDPSQDVPKEEG